jgi:hypothetical protein
MTKITPRFFVLPLIAIAVIVSLPRPSAQTCVAQGFSAGTVRADANSPTGCAPSRQQLVMASTPTLVR